MGDIFDTLAAGQPAQPSQAPPSQVPAPTAPGGGDIFDQLAAGKNPNQEAPPENIDPRAAIGKGFVKGVGQTVNTISKGLHAIPGIGETLAPQQGINAMNEMTQTHGTAENVGAGAENVLEFMAGDEALKGLSVAARLKELHIIASFLEKYPKLAQIAGTGLRSAGVSAGQAVAHGGDVGTSAVVGGGLGAAAEGVQQVVKGAQSAAQPEMTKIAGEEIPKSTEIGGKPQPKLAAQQQEGAQKVISTTASDAASKHTTALTGKATDATSFGEAAQKIKQAAQPVYKALDEVSGNEYTAARNEMDKAQKVLRRATSLEDMQSAQKAYDDAADKVDKIFDQAKSSGKVQPGDLENARKGWRDMKVLEKLHTYIDKAYSMPEAESQMTGKARELDPSKLRSRLTSFINRMPKEDVERVLGKDGLKNLSDLTELNSNPSRAQQFDKVVDLMSKGYAGKVVQNVEEAHNAMARLIFQNPKAGKVIVSGIKLGASPSVIVPTALAHLNPQEQQESQ